MNDDGGPAFPSFVDVDTFDGDLGRYVTHTEAVGGMSLLDYFAAKAMQGICASGDGWPRLRDFPEVADRSYGIANAMLAERKTRLPKD